MPDVCAWYPHSLVTTAWPPPPSGVTFVSHLPFSLTAIYPSWDVVVKDLLQNPCSTHLRIFTLQKYLAKTTQRMINSVAVRITLITYSDNSKPCVETVCVCVVMECKNVMWSEQERRILLVKYVWWKEYVITILHTSNIIHITGNSHNSPVYYTVPL